MWLCARSGIWIIGVVATCVHCTLSPPDKKQPKSQKPQTGPRRSDVLERGLVVEAPPVKDILKNHLTYYQETSFRNFNNTVLGYVTPWNSRGYDIAKQWAGKLSLVSPVWLQVRRQSPRIYIVSGFHDVDHAWIKTLRQKGADNKLKVVPRILFDSWQPGDLKAFFSENESEAEQFALMDEVRKMCKQWKFDGVVLEVMSQVGKYAEHAVSFVQKFGLFLSQDGLELILVYPPFRGYPADEFFVEAFSSIYPYVTAVSVMTYDFSNVQNPGPNAPLHWMRLCLEKLIGADGDSEKRSKLLLGLNFYGSSYTTHGGGPIVGTEYIELLKHAKPNQILIYNNNTAEHYLEVRTPMGSNKIFFPTLYSIQKRLDLAREYGTGVAIWELGQGLEYFMDLL